MRATSRALAALALTSSSLLLALPTHALPGQDPSPAPAGGASAAPSRRPAVVQLDPTRAVPAPPVSADSWVLADLDSGAILAQQDPDLPVRPASTFKLLTALTVGPRLAPEQPYRAGAADEAAEGNRVVMYDGLTYTVADLMHAALLPSANDAAEALARANGGIARTVEQMNEEAARLGATRTRVVNPSGLDADGQLTTAHDMALVGRAAFANREIASYLALRVVDFPGKVEAGRRVIYPIYNHNRTVANNRLPGYLGGKSGYTSQAGNTLVAAAGRDGRRLLVTLFHIGGNTYRGGEELLEWGFANADALTPVGQLTEPQSPAPQFDRTVTALPPAPAATGVAAPPAGTTSGAPERGGTPAGATTATPQADSPEVPAAVVVASPAPGRSTPLGLLTLLAALVAVLRARVYWRSRRTGGLPSGDRLLVTPRPAMTVPAHPAPTVSSRKARPALVDLSR